MISIADTPVNRQYKQKDNNATYTIYMLHPSILQRRWSTKYQQYCITIDCTNAVSESDWIPIATFPRRFEFDSRSSPNLDMFTAAL
jgi:hypothetical protein